MGSIKKVKLNYKSVGRLLKSDEVLQVCKDHAYSAQSKLGEGYEVTFQTAPSRALARVEAKSPEAIQKNRKHNTIIKAVLSS